MSWMGVITNAGQDLLNKWASGGHTLTIEGATVGSGYRSVSEMEAATALVNEVGDASIIGTREMDDATQFRISIVAAQTSYIAHEIGIWAHVDNGERTLLAYHQDRMTGVNIPSISESPNFAFVLYAVHAFRNDGTMTVNIDQSAYVTTGTFNYALAHLYDSPITHAVSISNTLTANTVQTNSLRIPHSVSKGDTPSSENWRALQFLNDGVSASDTTTHANRTGTFVNTILSSGNVVSMMTAYKPEANSSDYHYIGIYYPKSGDPYIQLSTQTRVTGRIFVNSGKAVVIHNVDVTKGSNPSATQYGSLNIADSTTNNNGESNRLGAFRQYTYNSGTNAVGMYAYKNVAGSVDQIGLAVNYPLSDAPFVNTGVASIRIERNDDVETYLRVRNSLHTGSLTVNNNGLLCLWSATHQSTLIQMSVDGITKVRCSNGMYRPVGTQDTDGIRVGVISSTSTTAVRVYGQKGTAGANYAGYTLLIGTSDSDIRLKKNIKSTEINALSLLNAIEMKSFDWLPGRRDYTHQPIGMIADQIEKLDSRLVMGGGHDPDGTPNYKAIDDHYLICYLTKAIQELSAKINVLERRTA